jgi:hypothetical protein
MVNQTEEVFGNPKQVGIGSVSSARPRGAMGSIPLSDATNALDVIAEDTKNSNKLKLNDSLKKDVESVLSDTEGPGISPSDPPVKEGLGGLRPRARPKPKRFSPIDKVLELNYLLKGKSNPNSKTTSVISGLDQSNPDHQKTIKGFFDSAVGGDSGFDPTTQAWCAAFVSHILEELGADPLKSKDKYDRLRADKFKNYGTEVEPKGIKEGDVVVFDFDQDGKADHVTFYAGDRITSQGMGGYINVLGGNQSGQVSIRENHPLYTWNNVAAIRRVTYNDIDFDFTKEMAERDPVFNEFMPDYAGSTQASPATFDKGGLAQQTDNQGGQVMNNQMEMAFMEQGGIKDDGMKKDPVSGNPIPPGSMAKEVRDDIPAMLSEGEYVVPADVLRFYGVNFFEDLRGKAKQGLNTMEQNGRIGGEPLSPQQVQQNMSKAPVTANAGVYLAGQPQGLQQAQSASQNFNPMNYPLVGGSTLGGGQQQDSITTFKTYVDSGTGQRKVLEFVNGKLKNRSDEQYTAPPYYEFGSAALKKAQQAATAASSSSSNPTDDDDPRPPPEPKDPNEWAKEITDPSAWAKENLQGKANTILSTIKLGTSVARINAMAIVADAQGKKELAAQLRGTVRDFLGKNPVLNSLPNAWIDGDQIAVNIQKDPDLIKQVIGQGVKDPAPKPPPAPVVVPSQGGGDESDPFKDVKAQVAATKAKGEELKKTNEAVASASEEYESNQAAQAEMAEAAEAGGATQGGPGGQYGMTKGGLMAKGKKKK